MSSVACNIPASQILAKIFFAEMILVCDPSSRKKLHNSLLYLGSCNKPVMFLKCKTASGALHIEYLCALLHRKK